MNEAHIPTPSDHQRDVVRGILQRGMELLDAKGHDYAGDDSAFINFTLTGMILDWAVSRGVKGEDLAFVSDIALKFARLIELRGSGKTPKNETIEDTCMDLANYAALWGGWILTKDKMDWHAMTVKEQEQPDLDYEAAKEATGYVKGELPTAKEYREMTDSQRDERDYCD